MDKPTHIKGPWNPKNFLNSVGDNQDILRMFELENKEELEEVLHSLSKEIDYIPRSESVFKRTKNKQRVEYAMTISVSEKRRKNIIGILRQLGIFSWHSEEDENSIFIDDENDIKKLKMLGLIEGFGTGAGQRYGGESNDDPKKETDTHVPLNRKTASGDFPRFARKRNVVFPQRSGDEKRKHQKGAVHKDDQADLVDELNRIIKDWRSESVEDKDSVKITGVFPTLTLFPQKYFWRNGVLHKKDTGEVISEEERKKMYESAKNNTEAMREVIFIHMGFLLLSVYEFKKKHPTANADDLLQEAIIGLIYAVHKHKKRDANFISYANYSIMGKLDQYMENKHHLVRLPTNQHLNRNRIIREIIRIYNSHPSAIEPTPEYIAHALCEKGLIEGATDYNLDLIKRLLFIGERMSFYNLNFTEVGLDVLDKEAGVDVVDMSGNPTHYAPEQEKGLLSEDLKSEICKVIMSQLENNKAHRLILYLRFGIVNEDAKDLFDFFKEMYKGETNLVLGEENSLVEIGRFFDITKGGVGQIIAQFIARINRWRPNIVRRLRDFLND